MDKDLFLPLLSDYTRYTMFQKFGFPQKLLLKYLEEKISKSKASMEFTKKNGEVVGFIMYDKLDWDSEQLGINVSGVEYLVSKKLGYDEEKSIKIDLLKKFDKWAQNHQVSLASARVSSLDLSSIHALEETGFKKIETLLTFAYEIKNYKTKKPRRVVSPFSEDEIDKLMDIGAESFVLDRFHSDPRLDPQKSNGLYREWVKNSCKGFVDEVLVAREKQQPVGFVTCKIEDLTKYFRKKFGIIQLIATHPKFRQMGVGSDLIIGALEWFKKENVDAVRVGTQSTNIGAINLYIKSGFKPINSEVTLHKWFK